MTEKSPAFVAQKDLCDEAGYLLNPEYLVEKMNHRVAYLIWQRDLAVRQLDRAMEQLAYILGPTRDVKTPHIRELAVEIIGTLEAINGPGEIKEI